MKLFIQSGNNVQLSDEELLSRLLSSGRTEWLGVLFERYLHMVFGLCLKYYKDSDDAKDAVMCVYEKLSVEIFRHEVKNFKSWLYVLAKNHCLMALRKNSAYTSRYVEYNERYFVESTLQMHPIDDAGQSDKEKALSWCLKQLKEQQRVCVEMFYLKNLSYRQISEQTEIMEKHVKSYIQNGKRNLKICIDNFKN